MKKNSVCWCLALIAFSLSGYSQSFDYKQIDSAKEVIKKYNSKSTDYFQTCLFIANSYWEKERYDTAQIWLDDIAGSEELKKISPLHYQHLSAQIKIYYNGNLHQLGINECKDAIALAARLNDSLLLQDAYTLLGYFYYNTDSIPLSQQYLNKALSYSSHINSNTNYIGLWSLHEIYLGIAYNYIQAKDLNNALVNANLSCKIAEQSSKYRYIIDSYSLLQLLHFKLNQVDSNLYYSIKIDSISRALNNKDYAILAYVGYIRYYDTIHNQKKVIEYCNKGIDLLKADADINPFYAQEFLFTAISRYRKYGDYLAAIDALELRILLSFKTFRNTAMQTTGIENAILKKETKILAAELNEAKQKRKADNLTLISTILVFVLICAALLGYLYHQKQKLRVTDMKTKISRDLHDDIGASLSSIHIFGDLATSVWDTQPGQSKEMVTKISLLSKELMERMNDIVWSLKPSANEQNSLSIKLRNFSHDFLAIKGIKTLFDIDEKLDITIQNPLVRTNLLLIAKESINNIAKYSGANQVNILLRRDNEAVILRITDNGKGFDKTQAGIGNGLENIKQRCSQLNGNCSIDTGQGEGVTVTCQFPVAIISHTG